MSALGLGCHALLNHSERSTGFSPPQWNNSLGRVQIYLASVRKFTLSLKHRDLSRRRQTVFQACLHEVLYPLSSLAKHEKPQARGRVLRDVLDMVLPLTA